MTDGYAWETTGEQRAYPADRLGKPSRRRGLPFFIGRDAENTDAPRTDAESAGVAATPESLKRKGMPVQDLVELLKNNPYPGRGIVVGKDTVYYFIMGLSVNSRNRIFAIEPDGIRTEAHDPALLEDPSLIIYHPVRTMGDALVVTNGDQTDTIVEAGDFRAGCMQREYEPDAPNFTPRISAIVNPDGSFEMSILKHADGDRCTREFFAYEGVDEGCGYFISTYQGDGNPLPTFAGEPIPVTLPTPDALWAALNDDNKVSLYANVGGEVTLYNKNLGD